MIPVSLTMEGFYSYAARTVVDFRALTAARMFGIFGRVGSGKSSILEAITLALYGESSRLNQRDSRSYNMLNLRSDRLSIDFRFEHGGALYRFTVEAKRSGSRAETVGTFTRRAYRNDRELDEWVPLDRADAEPVTGLSYTNFKRTTIIPQGRFQEFLQLGARERTTMMQELFSLDRFDLFDRANALATDAQRAVDRIESALAEIPAHLEENLEELRSTLDSARRRRPEIVQTMQRTRDRLARVRNADERRSERDRVLAYRASLRERAPEIAELSVRLEHLETVRSVIKPLLEAKDAAAGRLLDAERRLETTEATLAPSAARLAGTRETLEAARAAHARRGERERLRDALRRATELNPVQRRIDSLDAELHSHRRDRAHYESKAAALRVKINETAEGLPSHEELRARSTTIEREQARRGSLANIVGRRADTLRSAGVSAHIETAAGARALRLQLEEEMRVAAEQEHARRRSRYAVELAAGLSSGEPCPVCGALEHPHPADESDTADTVDAAAQSHPHARAEELQRIASLEAKLEALEEEQQRLERAGDSERADMAETELSAAARAVELAWRDHDALIALRAELGDAERNAADLASRESAAAAGLNELSSRRESIAAEIDRALQGTGDQTREEFAALRGDDPAGAADAIDRELVAAADELERLGEEVGREEREHTRLATQRDERRAARDTARTEYEAAELAYRRAVEDASLPEALRTEHAVREMINQTGEIETLRRGIAEHTDSIARTEERIVELERQLADLNVSGDGDASAEDLAQAVATMERELHELDTELGRRDHQARLIEERIARRDQLVGQLEATQVRRDNLKTLTNLFRGGGFVAYVAYAYLEQLVRAADARFRRLTHNHLSLRLNVDREFEIVDRMNGGRSRSIKTLSGGQTFQAALCLALALADSIRPAGDEPSFFFIDEGFGSLDIDSLREVFATLKELRREQRIVGVISHVEALQQEIEVSLRVTLDEHQGSYIEMT